MDESLNRQINWANEISWEKEAYGHAEKKLENFLSSLDDSQINFQLKDKALNSTMRTVYNQIRFDWLQNYRRIKLGKAVRGIDKVSISIMERFPMEDLLYIALYTIFNKIISRYFEDFAHYEEKFGIKYQLKQSNCPKIPTNFKRDLEYHGMVDVYDIKRAISYNLIYEYQMRDLSKRQKRFTNYGKTAKELSKQAQIESNKKVPRTLEPRIKRHFSSSISGFENAALGHVKCRHLNSVVKGILEHSPERFQSINFEEWDEWEKSVASIGGYVYDFITTQTLGDLFTKRCESYTTQGGSKKHKWQIGLSDLGQAWMQRASTHRITQFLNYIPLTIPPKPWTGFNEGGYHGELSRWHKCKLVKVPYSKDIEEFYNSKIPQSWYDAINKIQSTPLTVNEEMLCAIQKLYHIRQDEPLTKSIPIRTPLEKPYIRNGGQMVPPKQYYDQIREMLSQKTQLIVLNTKLGMAEKILGLGYEGESTPFVDGTFYLIWNADYRGRLYPCSSTLNPQGGDIDRALIKFKHKIPMGDTGERELAYHIANTYGLDKELYSVRYQWVLDNSDRLIDVAKDYIGNRWWEDADKPFQFLSACMEWKNYKESGLGEEYLSNLVCTVDGTCNGLQHYSMLVGDTKTAREVNVLAKLDVASEQLAIASRGAAELRGDIYSYIGRAIKERLYKERDSRQGFGSNNAVYAHDWITLMEANSDKGSDWASEASWEFPRKLVKGIVMPYTYGKKGMTVRDDIHHYIVQEVEMVNTEGTTITKWADYPFTGITSFEDVAKRFKYLQEDIIFRTLEEEVPACYQVMTLVKKVTKLAIESRRKNKTLDKFFHWVTPSGFPVAFFNRKFTTKLQSFSGSKGSTRVDLGHIEVIGAEEEQYKLNTATVINSSPPNFIHGIDSSHLILYTNTRNIDSYYLIHDSVGGRPGEMEVTKEVICSTFFKLYDTSYVLEDFVYYILKEELKLSKDNTDETGKHKSNLHLEEVLKVIDTSKKDVKDIHKYLKGEYLFS